jgi:hypothetical protein
MKDKIGKHIRLALRNINIIILVFNCSQRSAVFPNIGKKSQHYDVLRISISMFMLTISLDLGEEGIQSNANGEKLGFTMSSANRRQVEHDCRRFSW